MPITRVRPQCSVKGCPWKYEPEKHHCIAAGEAWHTCNGTASHQHVPRRNHPGSRIVAIVCLPNLHMALDQGFPHVGFDGVKRRLANRVVDSWYEIYDKESGEVLLRTEAPE